MDTIYFSHDSHELCLTDFEHLEQRDLICIISALEHNTWFTKLRASANTSKLAGEVLDKILAVVAKSPSLQELHLSSAGVRLILLPSPDMTSCLPSGAVGVLPEACLLHGLQLLLQLDHAGP